MAQFLYRIQPARSQMLSAGPTERESTVVAEHFTYLEDLLSQGVVLMAGRTMNADETTFGIVILEVASQEEAERVMRNDPAVFHGVMTAQLFPYAVALWSKAGPGDSRTKPGH